MFHGKLQYKQTYIHCTNNNNNNNNDNIFQQNLVITSAIYQ